MAVGEFNKVELVRIGAIVRAVLAQQPVLSGEALEWLARATDEQLGEAVIDGVAAAVGIFRDVVDAVAEGRR